MPDVREVYEMVTKQNAPEPGALERQQKRQVRTARNRKYGALAVVTAIGIAAIVAIFATGVIGGRSTPGDQPTPSADPRDAQAEGIARGFLTAFAAFDAEEAMSYIADGADLAGVIDPQLPPNEEGLSRLLALFEAQGYKQTITQCRAASYSLNTNVTCDFDFHLIRSDEVGRGPFTGSYFTFALRDGEIVVASLTFEIEEFAPQMWEPFAKWVEANHPEDFDVMYLDSGSNFRITPRSIRLWRVRSREYVDSVAA
jgi:hypothetical protein